MVKFASFRAAPPEGVAAAPLVCIAPMEENQLPSLVAASAAVRRHFAGRPVLVTGGMGFLGSNLVRALVLVEHDREHRDRYRRQEEQP